MDLQKKIVLTLEDMMDVATTECSKIGEEMKEPMLSLALTVFSARLTNELEKRSDEKNYLGEFTISVNEMRDVGRMYCDEHYCDACPLFALDDEGCFIGNSDEDVKKHYYMLKKEGLIK